MKLFTTIAAAAALFALAGPASAHRDHDGNPPGPVGGPGAHWENPPGPAGGPGASPNRNFCR